MPRGKPPGYAHPTEGAIYAKVDSYTLYPGDMDQGISIPGTDVCIEGEQLRSKERFTLAETKTDLDKCRILDLGDDERVTCPPQADTRIVWFDGYLTAPMAYTLNTCLEYDTSHCFIRERSDMEM